MIAAAHTGTLEERLRRLERLQTFAEAIVCVSPVPDGVVGGPGGVGGASGYLEEFAAAGGLVLTLSQAVLPNTELVRIDEHTICRRVGSSPGLNEYTLSGTTVTLGTGTLTGTSRAIVQGLTSAGVAAALEEQAGPSTTFALAHAPLAATLLVGIDDHTLCRLVGSSPGLNEYTLSGTTLTFGTGTLLAGSTAWARYLY